MQRKIYVFGFVKKQILQIVIEFQYLILNDVNDLLNVKGKKFIVFYVEDKIFFIKLQVIVKVIIENIFFYVVKIVVDNYQ